MCCVLCVCVCRYVCVDFMCINSDIAMTHVRCMDVIRTRSLASLLRILSSMKRSGRFVGRGSSKRRKIANARVESESERKKRVETFLMAIEEDDWKEFCEITVKMSKQDLNTPNADDWTPLQWASSSGHPHMVKQLIQRGAHVNLSDNRGTTALFIASQEGHTDTVRVLCEFHADVNKARKDGATPLVMSSQEGHTDTVRVLCEFHADVNKPNKNGATPLFISSQEGYTDTVRVLCEFHADVSKPRKNGATPLEMASHKGHTDIVRTLCEFHADVNKTSNNGRTPLFVASQEGHTDIVRVLCEFHADVNKPRKDGTTPLHVAALMGRMAVVKYLVKDCHVAIHTTAFDGSTPITSSSREEIAHYLKRQMMKVFIEGNILPFCKDVLKIIIHYLQ